jgi:hypothetical protein
MMYRAILQFIHPHDFDYSLALVSRSFRVAVEAHFYKYIAVPEKRLLFFCRTMLARPDLARCVQRLAFTGAVHREPEAADTDVVAETMRLLVNLKDLSITASMYFRRAEERPWPVHHDDVRILYVRLRLPARAARVFLLVGGAARAVAHYTAAAARVRA